MSQGLDTQMVKQYYERMNDAELIRIITEDAIGLTPEGKEIALSEVKRRGLNPNLLQGIDAQEKDYTAAELESMCSLIQSLPCPVCKKNEQPLNGTIVSETVSAILVTSVHEKTLIACPGCLDMAMRKGNTKTVLLGWWGFPWGIVRSIRSLLKNASFRKTHHTHFPNDILRGFVAASAGKIVVYKDDRSKLSSILQHEAKIN